MRAQKWTLTGIGVFILFGVAGCAIPSHDNRGSYDPKEDHRPGGALPDRADSTIEQPPHKPGSYVLSTADAGSENAEDKSNYLIPKSSEDHAGSGAGGGAG